MVGGWRFFCGLTNHKLSGEPGANSQVLSAATRWNEKATHPKPVILGGVTLDDSQGELAMTKPNTMGRTVGLDLADRNSPFDFLQ